MSHAANVRSLDALGEFRTALIKFIDMAKRAIATAESELQRTHTWLNSTQALHWTHEIRRAEELLNQAKSELYRAKLSQPDNPRAPTDQVRLVRKRQSEIVHAQEKKEKAKRWSRTLERETNEYRGALSPLSSSLDGQLHKAVVLIDRSIKTLESYITTSLPSSASEISVPSDTTSIARHGDDIHKEDNDEHANSDCTTHEGDENIDVPVEPSE